MGQRAGRCRVRPATAAAGPARGGCRAAAPSPLTTTPGRCAEYVRRVADGDAHGGRGEQRLVRRPVAAGDRALHGHAEAAGDEAQGVALVHAGSEDADEAGPDGQHPQPAGPLLPQLAEQPRDGGRVAVEHEPAGGRPRLVCEVAPGPELARLVHVPDGHAELLGQAAGDDGVSRTRRHRQVAQHRAVCLRNERAVIARVHTGLHAERRGGPARGLQRSAGDDGEEGAGADELRERLAGAGHRCGLVVQQRAVEVAGDEHRSGAWGRSGRHRPQCAPPAAGRCTVNRAPPPGASSAAIVPPCASTRARQMARPRPAPAVPRESCPR